MSSAGNTPGLYFGRNGSSAHCPASRRPTARGHAHPGRRAPRDTVNAASAEAAGGRIRSLRPCGCPARCCQAAPPPARSELATHVPRGGAAPASGGGAAAAPGPLASLLRCPQGGAGPPPDGSAGAAAGLNLAGSVPQCTTGAGSRRERATSPAGSAGRDCRKAPAFGGARCARGCGLMGGSLLGADARAALPGRGCSSLGAQRLQLRLHRRRRRACNTVSGVFPIKVQLVLDCCAGSDIRFSAAPTR